jgi:uncharacterized protein
MGPKSYEQCAGFLKIPESAEPLDNTWVHPENYTAAREIQELLAGNTVTTSSGPAGGNLSGALLTRLREEHGIGDTTIKDIVEELKKPNRDPRDDYPRPILQKGVVSFEDLSEGMTITGKIKNVVDFGAFVDIGIKETALVHISELSDHYIKDPMGLVKAGDVYEFRIIALDKDRKRISLSRKKGERPAPGPAVQQQQAGRPAAGQRSGAVRHSARHAVSGQSRSAENAPAKTADRPARAFQKQDDGTMYNPFAEAFKKPGQAQNKEK